MQPEDAAQIAEWVKAGGVLMILENDPANADLDHLNLLSEKFGIHYNSVLRNAGDGNKFEMGKVANRGRRAHLPRSAHCVHERDLHHLGEVPGRSSCYANAATF